MATNRVTLTLGEGSIQIEGPDKFLSETIERLVGHQSRESAETLIGEGLDHAWNWFSLHATQRLQGVYFFLLASAFLSGAYVSALHFDLPSVAVGLGVLGFMFSIAFYMLESRVRELLKAGEQALKPAQRKVAELTGVSAFAISDAVEKPKYPVTAYSKVFRMLFLVAILGSAFGILYALHLAVPRLRTVGQNTLALVLFYRCTLVAAAVIVLGLSAKLANRPVTGWVRYMVIIGLLAVGIFVLVASAFRPLT